ncbi:potassium-transporting ATPase subunit KdpC [Litorihabitans aurantiacus]|uniref:Potassium-transporting ATPase KdpC subunit n=1 Tax=Litorihabitans aurantiacus TaxID=1930061 RepID=A0AA37XGW1_9MICO|nr:potassium-transporting ATPase subunit KdpC [Litorihabitans aurantiacus]GMA33002.1 potassium-transporting ATPase KdpC subunit [Litorihabitans aurantiacus]
MSFVRPYAVALRFTLLSTVVLGLGYPLVITGVSAVIAPERSAGSLVENADGEVVGSRLIGQSFTDSDGAALPDYVQSRPSAAGDSYDASASSGSNLGPENPDLVAAIEERRAAIAELEGVAVEEIPADAVTTSSSGLDPHISPEYAAIQVERVAEARGVEPDVVRAVVEQHTDGRGLGFLGEPTVNVLELNLALDAEVPSRS